MRTSKPMMVHCGSCQHEWVCAYLPMAIEKLAPLMKSPCPMCGGKEVRSGIIPRETRDGDAEAWVGNGDTGTSSLTIWAVLMKRVSPHGYLDAPHDPDDFGRCYRLLRIMPSWRARLSEVASACQAWGPMVDHWDELVGLWEREKPSGYCPDLYDRMQILRGDDPVRVAENRRYLDMAGQKETRKRMRRLQKKQMAVSETRGA